VPGRDHRSPLGARGHPSVGVTPLPPAGAAPMGAVHPPGRGNKDGDWGAGGSHWTPWGPIQGPPSLATPRSGQPLPGRAQPQVPVSHRVTKSDWQRLEGTSVGHPVPDGARGSAPPSQRGWGCGTVSPPPAKPPAPGPHLTSPRRAVPLGRVCTAHCPRRRAAAAKRSSSLPVPVPGRGHASPCRRTGCASPGPAASGRGWLRNEKSLLMPLAGHRPSVLPRRTRRRLCRRRREFGFHLGRSSCGQPLAGSGQRRPAATGTPKGKGLRGDAGAGSLPRGLQGWGGTRCLCPRRRAGSRASAALLGRAAWEPRRQCWGSRRVPALSPPSAGSPVPRHPLPVLLRHRQRGAPGRRHRGFQLGGMCLAGVLLPEGSPFPGSGPDPGVTSHPAPTPAPHAGLSRGEEPKSAGSEPKAGAAAPLDAAGSLPGLAVPRHQPGAGTSCVSGTGVTPVLPRDPLAVGTG